VSHCQELDNLRYSEAITKPGYLRRLSRSGTTRVRGLEKRLVADGLL
jgi:hypothetical protein